MVEGTKEFRKKNLNPATLAPRETEPSSEAPLSQDPLQQPISSPEEISDATNLGRREWFSSLVPAMGGGLVKLLRASNNLQRDLQETLSQKTDDLLSATQDSDHKP